MDIYFFFFYKLNGLSKTVDWMKLKGISKSWLSRRKKETKHLTVENKLLIKNLKLMYNCYWNGLHFPSPGHLTDPCIKLRSPALQVDSLSSEPPGKHFIINTACRKSCYKVLIWATFVNIFNFPKFHFIVLLTLQYILNDIYLTRYYRFYTMTRQPYWLLHFSKLTKSSREVLIHT